MAAKKTPPPGDPSGTTGSSELLLYTTPDQQTRIEVRLEGETVWPTQRQMAVLFDRSVKTINEHVQNVYAEGELQPEATIRRSRIVQDEGGRQVARDVELSNIDVIISVGYRVKSHRGTQFRIWATQRLREYLVKGFALDDERLREGKTLAGGRDYFDELLERIRDIRASEKGFYQKVCDIYRTSVDYDAGHELTQAFFATVQNRLRWAIHGRTAADCRARRRVEDEHGPHDLEGRAEGPDPEGRCGGGEELPRRDGATNPEPARRPVPLLRRVPGAAAFGHDDCGTGRESSTTS